MTVDDLLKRLEGSRAYFLRHLDGMTDEQCAWKPYAECKTVLETLAHLRIDDLAALESLESGEEPNYEEISAPILEAAPMLSRSELLNHLKESHADLVSYLRTKHANSDLDTEICVWGSKMPIGSGIPFLSSEDYYHAGQIAFIRMGQDPSWNYYAAVYA